MQNPVAFGIDYREHLRQTAWINENDWQFVPPPRKHPVRRIVVGALHALARIAAPAQPPTRPATMP
jgi:hypothetical protein